MKHVIAVIDRSGSMARIVDDMNEGMKSWLKDMKKQAPKGTLFSAILFDDSYEVVYEREPIENIKKKSLMIIPRGSTALLDSMMKALSLIKDDESALVVVTTDGQENASTETKLDALQKRVAELTKRGIEFIYMSSDANAFKDAQIYGATQTFAYGSAKDMSIYATAARSNSTKTYLTDSKNPSTATKKENYPKVTDINVSFDSVSTDSQQDAINTVINEGVNKFQRQIKNKKELLPT